jgi:hypothetical protein
MKVNIKSKSYFLKCYASIKIIRPPVTKDFLRKIYVWIIIVRINIMKGAKKKLTVILITGA